jgi:hypothetical protein
MPWHKTLSKGDAITHPELIFFLTSGKLQVRQTSVLSLCGYENALYGRPVSVIVSQFLEENSSGGARKWQ